MTREELSRIYLGYIDCLNRQGWQNLGTFVGEAARYNGALVGLAGHRQMLEHDFNTIPDLHFNVRILVADPPQIAARLHFDCTPVGVLFDLPVNGKRVQFDENVFYEFVDGRIESVWSVIDKAAIAAQIRTPTA